VSPPTGPSSLLGAALRLTAGRALAFGAAFLVPVVLARVLAQAEFGAYKQLFLLYSTIYYTAQLGAATSLFYFVPRTPARAARYAGNALAVLGAAGAVAALALVAGRERVVWLFGGSALGGELPELGAYLALTLVAAPLEIVLIARGRIAGASASYALSDLARAGCLVLPAAAGGGVAAVMGGAVLFAVARAAVALIWLRRELGAPLATDRTLLGEQLGYALPFGLAVLIATLQAHAHQLFVSHAFDAATFAIYAVGCLQIPLVDFLATPTGDVMMVRMSEALAARRRDLAVATWHEAVAHLALFLFPLAALLIVAAEALIPWLFTDAYRASVPIFRLWTCGVFVAPFLVEGVLRVFAATRTLVLLSTAQLLLVVTLIQPAIGRFGLAGAVLVSLLATAMAKALALAFAARHLGAGARLLPWRRLMGTGAATGVAAAATIAVQATAGLADLPALLLDGLVFGAVYGALVLAWGLAPPGSVAALRERVGSRFRRVPRGAAPESSGRLRAEAGG
jgi:O-antigen/teichoic acid export membrane protein